MFSKQVHWMNAGHMRWTGTHVAAFCLTAIRLAREKKREGAAQPMAVKPQPQVCKTARPTDFHKEDALGNETVAKIVKRAKNGDEAATEELYRLHCHRIYSLCIRMVANQSEAEDLTQEIFLHAFRKIRTFRGEAAFSTWLYRLGVNVVLMRLRKKSHPTVSLDEVTWPNGEAMRRIEPADKTDHAKEAVDRLALREALDQLPSGFKRVVVMHDMEGYNHREIAELTGRSVGNSKSQLHKARRRLRELLTEGPGIPGPQALAAGHAG